MRAEAEFFGDLDGFVDDGVVGNAIEPESLVETEAEENLQRDFLDAALGLARDEPVERGLPADDTAAQFADETAVGGGECRAGEFLVEQVFEVVFLVGVAAQDADRNLSWFFHSHASILPIAQVLASF